MNHDSNAIAKLEKLRGFLGSLDGVAVAFSAGADSSLLLHAARSVLGEKAIAVTIRAPMVPDRELDEAAAFCKSLGVRHEIVEFDALSIPAFAQNAPDRCYHCKKALLSAIASVARANGFSAVAEGSNADDDGDFRPGMRAVRELGVLSPLRDAGFSKRDVRSILKELGLAVCAKPSSACLASRIPYGTPVTAEALKRIGKAEDWLRDNIPGLGQLRVRALGDSARIEVPLCDLAAIAERSGSVVSALTELGFRKISLDLQGFRSGSMNDSLTESERLAALGSPQNRLDNPS